MKTILTFIMLIISTVTYSQTYNFSSNGYSTTVTVVGRNIYSHTSSPYDKGTISNRKMKKIEAEQAKLKEERKAKENKMFQNLLLTKDSIKHYVGVRDSLFSVHKQNLIKAFNEYPTDEATRKNVIAELKTKYYAETETIIENIKVLCDKGVNQIHELNMLLYKSKDSEKVYEYIYDNWRKTRDLNI